MLRGILLLILCGLATQPSYAVSFAPVAVFGYPGSSITPSTAVSGGRLERQNGVGLLTEFKMHRRMSMELGVLYATRGFEEKSTTDDSFLDVSFHTVQLPLLFRVYVPSTVSIGIGGFFSHGMGSVSLVNGGGGSTSTFKAAGYGADDSGFLVSVAAKMPIFSIFSLIIDGRYIYGLQNISKDPSTAIYLRDLQVLCGIRFGK